MHAVRNCTHEACNIEIMFLGTVKIPVSSSENCLSAGDSSLCCSRISAAPRIICIPAAFVSIAYRVGFDQQVYFGS